MSVLILSTTFAKTFLILKIQRDMFTLMYIGLHVKNPLFFSDTTY